MLLYAGKLHYIWSNYGRWKSPYASGGSAGCVVAGRLAYADPNLQVMLIEGKEFFASILYLLPAWPLYIGGANNKDDPWVYRPAVCIKHLQHDGM